MATDTASTTKFKDLGARALDIEKRTAELKGKFEVSSAGLKGQLKQKQGTSVTVILKVVQAEAAKMETLLSIYIPAARKIADELTNDTQFAEQNLKAIVAHTRSIDKSMATLTAMLKSAQAQEVEAEAFLDKQGSSADSSERVLAALKHNAGAFGRRLTKMQTTLAELSASAKEAVKARNGTALKAAKDQAKTVFEPAIKADIATTDRDVIRFRTEILAKAPSADAKARWTSELADFDDAREEIGKQLDACAATASEIEKLELPPPDADKAAAALQLDSKHRTALGKALRGDDATVLKNLDELAKKLGSKLTGKEMFSRLRKNKQI